MNKNTFANKPIQNHDLLQLLGFATINNALVCPLREWSPSLDIVIGDVRHDEA
jgi:hypothetical protein